MTSTPVPLFRLGTFSLADEPPFPGLVLAEQMHAIRDLTALQGNLGLQLHGTASVRDMLDRWDVNLPVLHALAEALASGASATGLPWTACVPTHRWCHGRSSRPARTITSTLWI